MAAIEPKADELRAREFHLTDEDFHALRELAKAHIGIHLSNQKRELVYGRVSRRLRALGLRSFGEYRELLSEYNSPELVDFCNAITTNLTAFFREAHHFDFIRENLLRSLSKHAGASRRLRFWSAGCSSGEEPYSLAITLHEALGDLAAWDIRILATDVDTGVLARAQAGCYVEERVRGVAPQLRAKYFLRESGGRSYTVIPTLRSRIAFKALNLIHELPMKGPLDVIFCRNVIIYFDKDTQRELFARIARLQQPGALLFLGHSESLFRVSEAYELIGKTIYRRC